MRRIVVLVKHGAMLVAGLSLLIVLFTVGDADFGATAPPPPITLAFAVLAGVSCVVLGMIHFIGLPPEEKTQDDRAKASRRQAKRATKTPPSG